MNVIEHWGEQTLDPPREDTPPDPPVGIAALDAEIDRLNDDIRRLALRLAESRRNLAAIIS